MTEHCRVKPDGPAPGVQTSGQGHPRALGAGCKSMADVLLRRISINEFQNAIELMITSGICSSLLVPHQSSVRLRVVT